MQLALMRYRRLSPHGHARGSSLVAAAVGSMLLVGLGMPLSAASCEHDAIRGQEASHSRGDVAVHTAHAAHRPAGDADHTGERHGPTDQPDAPADCAATMWCSVTALLVDTRVGPVTLDGRTTPTMPAADLASVHGGPEPPPPRS